MWTDDIQDIIFTKIKYGFSDKLKKKYPNIKVTDEKRIIEKTAFPTVFIQPLPSAEIAVTLEQKHVGAITYGCQIDVYSNEKLTEAREVMEEVMQIMKGMAFQILTIPPQDLSNADTYRLIARFRRNIGEGDKL